jgi:steroid delta-isomerase-like uncharacterized protein
MSRSGVHVLLSFVLLAGVVTCARDPQPGPTVAPEVFAREWLEAWDSHDVERIVTHYNEDAFYEDVPNVDNGWAEPMAGHQMIRESRVETFGEMPDLGFELVSASAAGDRVVVEWIMTGSQWNEFSGDFSIRAVSVIELRGDKIARVRDYYDAHLLLTQLGVEPPLGAEQS